MARPVVKFGALTGVLLLPRAAQALTVSANSNSNPSTAIVVNLSGNMAGTLFLEVEGRAGGNITLGPGQAGGYNLGTLNPGTGATNSDISFYALPANVGVFVAELEVSVRYTGYLGARVDITGTHDGTTDTSLFDALWACGNTPIWSAGQLNNPLTTSGVPPACWQVSVTGGLLPGLLHTTRMDAAFKLAAGAPTATYLANYNFTISAL